MKICVTGATGFIGCRLALILRGQGHDVVALAVVNNEVEENRRKSLEQDGIEFVEGSVNDTALLNRVLSGCEQVYHLAAAQHEANVDEAYFHRINVAGTKNMLEAAIANGVSRFLHGSTIGVYGSAMSGELDEKSPLAPDNHYGRTKLAGEQLVLTYRDRIDVTVIRISETYGPGDYRLLKLFKGIDKGMFFIAGNGQNIHQLIYVDDLIAGMVCAAGSARSVGEVYVLAGTERLSTNKMCEDVSVAVNSGKKVWHVPMFPLKLLVTVLEKLFSLVGKQPPVNRRSLDFFIKSFYFDQRKIYTDLGFSPETSFADGASRTALWYREKGLIKGAVE